MKVEQHVDRAIGWAFRVPHLRANAKMLLMVLCSLADENGDCAPHYDVIREQMPVTNRTLRRAVITLRERGLIQAERIVTAKDTLRQYQFKVLFPWVTP